MKHVLRKRVKRILAGTLATCIIAGVAIGYISAKQNYINKQMLLTQSKLYDSLKLSMTGVDTAEYGSSFDLHTLVAEHTGNLKIDGDINENAIGAYAIKLTLFGKESKFGITDSKTFTTNVKVVDTQPAVITLAQDTVELRAGASYDPYSNVASVVDPVDGSLTASAENGAGLYTVAVDGDTSKAGTYTATVTATDKNGNVSTASYTIRVTRNVVASIGPVDTSGNYEYIYAYLTGTLGLSRAAATGVLANMYQESKFDPTAGSSYYGLCQWGGGRLTNLMNYCANNGLDYTSVDGQLAFMTYELNGSYSSTLSGLQSVANTAEGAAEAATIFVSRYEGASHTVGRAERATAYFLAN
ncbi:MAG: phage tail tip lysozyme [Erysipelotrichaceae bacterium]|nr:phage tail tip lysozyme [Erysipelotrichaceae bacterium]